MRVGDFIRNEGRKFFITKVNKNTVTAREVLAETISKNSINLTFGDTYKFTFKK